MNILYRKKETIFDGNSDDLSSSVRELNFDAYKFQVVFNKLKPICDIQQHYKNIFPDDVSSSLGFKTTSFDGMRIYNGGKRGLKLYYDVAKGDSKDVILVFSFGEFQPGRFICQFEEAIYP